MDRARALDRRMEALGPWVTYQPGEAAMEEEAAEEIGPEIR